MNKATSALALAAFLASCASTPTAKEVEKLGPAAIVGVWTSELDHTVLTVCKDGTFTVVHGDATATGHWSTHSAPDGAASTVEFTNDGDPCAGIAGTYTPEVVRDTVRFTKRYDDCATREEHMAWPWTRAASGSTSGK